MLAVLARRLGPMFLVLGAILVAFTGTVTAQSSNENPPLTPAFEAAWIMPEGSARYSGGGEASWVLRPNLPLLERVVLEPDDVREAKVSLLLKPAPAGTARVLAQGHAADREKVEFGEFPALSTIQLNPGERLVITGFRDQFHYHGAVSLTSLKLERINDGVTVTLPHWRASDAVDTPLGTLRLVGLAKRGKLPRVQEQASVQAGNEPGHWKVKKGAGSKMQSSADRLRMATQGRKNFDAKWDWAPAVQFEPNRTGVYRLTGTLAFRSGKPAKANEPKTMRWLVMVRPDADAEPVAASLQVHRLLRSSEQGAPLAAGKDYAAEPVVTLPLDRIARGKPQRVELDDAADLATSWLREPEEAHGLLLRLVAREHGDAPLPTLHLPPGEIFGKLRVIDRPAVKLFERPVQVQEGVFARVKDGHLYYGDRRLKLWGVNGYPDPKRLVNTGFNAIRHYEPRNKKMYTPESAKRGEPIRYEKGDGSPWDQADRQIAQWREAGLFLVLATTQNTMPLKHVAVDGSFIAGGDDWEQWKSAMAELNYNTHMIDRGPLYFDERLQKIKERHAYNLLTHVNPYTGKAVGQDEAYVIYYVFNESGGVKRILEGSWTNWPAYFSEKFRLRWNDWLIDRYTDDAKLRAAWGELADGESLKQRAVRLGPSLSQRNDYPEQRADDFVRFVIEMIDDYHQDYRAYCRSLAPEGVGVNVAPFNFDTQYRPSLAWNYLQSRGDVNSFGMYFWDLESQLTEPPSAYVMDSHTVEGVPTVIYETNHGRPGRYRAEYPMKVATMALRQDWDGVFWHYFHKSSGAVDEGYLAQAMSPLSKSHYWTAVHTQDDPVMVASLAAAGQMFLHDKLDKADDPVVVEVGSDALFGYDRHNGVNLSQQTFTRGSLIRYRPDQPGGVTVDGEPLARPARLRGAVAMGDGLVWDWPNGRMIIDTPTVKAYVGKVAGTYRFDDGISLEPAGTPSVTFTMISNDGKPLVGEDASEQVYITAVGDAQNKGFEFDWSVRGGPREHARAVIQRGHAPVMVDPVGFTISFPRRITGVLQSVDFALRESARKRIESSRRVTYQGPTPFMHVLDVASRGEPGSTPGTTTPIAWAHGSGGNQTANGQDSESHDPVGPWHPVPGLSWQDDYLDTHKVIRDSSIVFTSIADADRSDAEAKTIRVSAAQLRSLWSLPADLEVIFDNDRMTKVVVTFKQPPPFDEAVTSLADRFGKPAEHKLGKQYENSRARWPASTDRPGILLTESQGIMKLILTRPAG